MIRLDTSIELNNFCGHPRIELRWSNKHPSWKISGTGYAYISAYTNGDYVAITSVEAGEKITRQVMHTLTNDQAKALQKFLNDNLKG